MNAWRAAVLAAIAAATAATAQVEVTCRPAFNRFLQFEVVRVRVTVRNETAELLTMGPGTNDWELAFAVEATPGSPLTALSRPMGEDTWSVPPHAEDGREFNLSTLFGLQEQGPHAIDARVSRGDDSYGSGRAFIDIVPGMVLIERRIALSGGGKRVLTLRAMGRDRGERIFLRMDDEQSAVTYGAQDLGAMVRLFEPELMLDRDDRIHVLHQESPTVFQHTVVAADGRVIGQTPLDTGGGRARLVRQDDGSVEMVGARPYRNSPLPGPPAAPEWPRRPR